MSVLVAVDVLSSARGLTGIVPCLGDILETAPTGLGRVLGCSLHSDGAVYFNPSTRYRSLRVRLMMYTMA